MHSELKSITSDYPESHFFPRVSPLSVPFHLLLSVQQPSERTPTLCFSLWPSFFFAGSCALLGTGMNGKCLYCTAACRIVTALTALSQRSAEELALLHSWRWPRRRGWLQTSAVLADRLAQRWSRPEAFLRLADRSGNNDSILLSDVFFSKIGSPFKSNIFLDHKWASEWDLVAKTVARQTPDQKVACWSHVRFKHFRWFLSVPFPSAQTSRQAGLSLLQLWIKCPAFALLCLPLRKRTIYSQSVFKVSFSFRSSGIHPNQQTNLSPPTSPEQIPGRPNGLHIHEFVLKGPKQCCLCSEVLPTTLVSISAGFRFLI